MNEKILIVDDDLESLQLIGMMLQRRGYKVIPASSGSEALAKAEHEKPHLVILDIMMPGLDGYRVCRELRSNPCTAHLPVLMFTAKTSPEDKTTGFEAGADGYLAKPVRPAELALQVEALLERPLAALAEARRLPSRRVVGVMGAKGGVGVTTLVVNLAAAVSRCQVGGPVQDSHLRVAVVELGAGPGTVALLLGQTAYGGWPELLGKNADALTLETIKGQMFDYGGGLRYLPASLRPAGGHSSLPPDHVNAVLNGMREITDYAFLDLGSVLDDAVRCAIGLCDILVVAVEPVHLCLVLARVLLDTIRDLENAPHDLRAVLVEHLVSPASPFREKIEEQLGCELVGVIKPAGGEINEAEELGTPVVLSHPDSKVAGQIRELAWALLS